MFFMNNAVLKIMDRLLREIKENDNQLGGKAMVLGGDFKQTLNIVPGGRKIDVNKKINKKYRAS